MHKADLNWHQVEALRPRQFMCGHCGCAIASERGYFASNRTQGVQVAFLYVCHVCERPTFFGADDSQVPGALFGERVAHIDDADVAGLYDEARRCISIGAHTSAVLACRKLLMHIAVAQGAKEDQGFKYYAEYLLDKGLAMVNATAWVTRIKDKGNFANHEIRLMSAQDAKDLVSFSAMLLKLYYELPGMAADNAGGTPAP